MSSRALSILPGLAVLVVVWLVLPKAGSDAVRAVVVLGGPPSGSPPASVLLRAVRLGDGRRTPIAGLSLSLSAKTPSATGSWRGRTDETGHAEASIEWKRSPSGPIWLAVTAADAPEHALAEGAWELAPSEWKAPAKRLGGWLEATRSGELIIAAAPARGALAVPFQSELLLRVGRRDPPSSDRQPQGTGEPVGRVQLELSVRGATLGESAGDALRMRRLETDEAGHARLRLIPEEHAVSIEVRARDAEGREGQLFGALPIVPGALFAEPTAQGLLVRSPIARSHAFVSLMDERERFFGAVASLQSTPSGLAQASVELPREVRERLAGAPAWAVVSSEHDKQSPGVVGWPVGNAAPEGRRPADALFEPQFAFSLPDQVLVDGVPRALARKAARQRRRRTWGGGLLLTIGTLLTWAFHRAVRNAPDGATDTLLGQSLSRSRAPMLFALACLIAGIVSLALFGTLDR